MKKITISTLLVLLISACSGDNNVPPRPVNAVIQGVNFIGSTVSDLEVTSDFYTNAVELQLSDEQEIVNDPVFNQLAGRSDVRLKTKLMKSTNTQVRFMQFESPSEAAKNTKHVEINGPGFAHVCYQAQSQTQAYQKFIKAGAIPIGDPDMIQLSTKNPVHYAYARDLDSTPIEVEHVDIEKLNRKTPPKHKYRIRHVALATPDFDRTIKFYSTLLEQEKPRVIGRFFSLSGEKFNRMSELKDVELKMAFFHVRNIELEIAQYISHPTSAPETSRPIDALGYNMVVFDVTDLALAKQKLIAAGGTVETQPQDMDGGKIFFGRDLDNNLLGFQLLEASSPYSAKNFENDGSS
jgi:catechol 2,3-dioxygenase-like lactoylglutathione lyase family enzyme